MKIGELSKRTGASIRSLRYYEGDFTMFKDLEFHTFHKEIEKGITLVEFGAKWCPPCRIQEPILQELSLEWGEHIAIAKVDVDQESELAAEFGIQGIPTLLIFKDGKKVGSLRGLHSSERIKSEISSFNIG